MASTHDKSKSPTEAMVAAQASVRDGWDIEHTPEKLHSVVRIATQGYRVATADAGDKRGRRPIGRRDIVNGQVK